jgi:hypothetical protein
MKSRRIRELPNEVCFAKSEGKLPLLFLDWHQIVTGALQPNKKSEK